MPHNFQQTSRISWFVLEFCHQRVFCLNERNKIKREIYHCSIVKTITGITVINKSILTIQDSLLINEKQITVLTNYDLAISQVLTHTTTFLTTDFYVQK